jgi:HPt (histidine-containing phosphotransfer) domain-containing protein
LEDGPVSLQTIAMAITNRDGPELSAAAHSLKGLAGAFRDRVAVAAAAHLEMIGRQEDWNQVESAWNGVQQEMARLSSELTHFLEVTQSTNIIDQGGTGA